MLQDISKRLLTRENIMALAIILVLMVIAVYLRSTMLKFYGFYEPDGFYYFSVIRAAVSNGLRVPNILSISGWPSHQPVTEAQGIFLITILPYSILRFFGVSYYDVMRLVPVAFALMEMACAYIISRYLSKDKLLGFLSMAFVGLSMGNAARTSALIYRGDSFVTLFLMVALILFIAVFKEENRSKKLVLALLAGIALATANMSWNGSPFADMTFVFSFLIIVALSFILRKERILNDSKYILLAILTWYVTALMVHAMGFIEGQQFVDPTFIPVLISISAFWAVASYATERIGSIPFLRGGASRLFALILVLVLGIGLFTVAEPSIVYNVFIGNGFVTSPGSFGTTIQELQPPTGSFLYTSFGVNLFTTPPTILMFLSQYLLGSQNVLWTSYVGVMGIILLFLAFLPYLFMQVYDSGGFLSGNARLRLDLDVTMAVIIAYFILTAYLQMHAIRFNSLVSIPLAIISAYTIYWLISFAKGAKSGRALVFVAFTTLFVVSLVMLVYFAFQMLLPEIMFGIGIIAGIACTYLYASPRPGMEDKHYATLVYALGAIFLIAFFAVLLTYDNIYSQSLSQADSINPSFLGALQWLKANSPSNSVVLTLWPDGSVVEGVANRTSVTDSVGSQNGTKMTPFAAWLLNSSSDPSFLTSRITGKPNYLLVRSTWLIETQGIYTEANITANQTLFGYLPFTEFEESQINATTKQLTFRYTPSGYPYAAINLKATANASQDSVFGYVQQSPTQTSPFSTVGFYNQANGNYTLVQQQSNASNGETMVVVTSPVPRPTFFLNITGAYLFAPGLGNSNMVKFLFFCGSASCAWNNNQSSMKLVYQNTDTKIFQISYR